MSSTVQTTICSLFLFISFLSVVQGQSYTERERERVAFETQSLALYDKYEFFDIPWRVLFNDHRYHPYKLIEMYQNKSAGIDVPKVDKRLHKRFVFYKDIALNRVDNHGNYVFEDITLQTVAKSKLKRRANYKSSAGNFQYIGQLISPVEAYTGRLERVAFHPTNENIIWASAPEGGLWKTTNGGLTWSIIDDHWDHLGTGDLIYDQNNHNILYLATDDHDSNFTDNRGLLKSTDGGVTWNIVGLDFATVGNVFKLGLQPDGSNLYACTTNGLFTSTDGGVNWTKNAGLPGSLIVNDMEYHPTNPMIMYVTERGLSTSSGGPPGAMNTLYFYVSTDGGISWSQPAMPFDSKGRTTQVAVSPDNPDIAIVATYPLKQPSNKQGLQVQKYVQSTGTVTAISDNTQTFHQIEGAWDFRVEVNPTNVDHIILGCVNMVETLNGGVSWQNFNNLHADIHDIEWQTTPTGTKVWVADDGGLAYSTNGGLSWTAFPNLPVLQPAKLASSDDGTVFIVGVQDAGNQLEYNGNYFRVQSGDGLECAVDPVDPNIIYHTVQQGLELARLEYNPANNTYEQFGNRMTRAIGGNIVEWATSLVIDREDHNTLYTAYADVWKSTDRGDNWTNITNGSFGNDPMTTSITFIMQSNSHPDIMYGAYGGYQLVKSTDRGLTWSNITSHGFFINSRFSNMIIHPEDPNTLWATGGGSQVKKSVDGGTTWTDYSTGLPPGLTMYAIAYQDGSPDGLYIAGILGEVWYRDNTLANWQKHDQNIPNVWIRDIEVLPLINKVRVVTWGRGIWEGDTYSASVNPCDEPLPPIIDATICLASADLVIDAAPAGYAIEWYRDGALLPAETSTTLTTTTAGIYTSRYKAMTGFCHSYLSENFDLLFVTTNTYYLDADEDGYGDPGTTTNDPCAVGYIPIGGDCNDSNPDIHPNAPEVCGNGLDDDCNGDTDLETNRGLHFDGVDDYLDVPQFIPYSSSFTVELWVKTSKVSGQALARWTGQNDVFSIIQIDGNRIFVEEDDGSQYKAFRGGNQVNDGNWHHVAVVKDGNSYTAYLDGQKAWQTSWNLLLNLDEFYIGEGVHSGHYFDGTMDDLRIWNVARTKEEINANMFVRLDGSESNLAAYFPFDQGDPGLDNSLIDVAFDSTGHSRNVELKNFALNSSTSNWVLTQSYPSLYADADMDGFGDESSLWQCGRMSDYVANKMDCDDSDENVNPNHPEVCGNGLDDNCNNAIDENLLGLHLDGIDDVVDFGTGAGNFGVNDFTLEFMFNTIQINRAIISKRSVCNYADLWNVVVNRDGFIVFEAIEAGVNSFSIPANQNVNDGYWHHVAISREAYSPTGATVRIYVDGVLILEGNTHLFSLSNSAPLRIGFNSCGYYEGSVDEFRIWDGVRSSEQIAEYKDISLLGNETNLVSYYNFDNSNAFHNTDNTGQTTVTDLAGSNNGTMTGFSLNGTESNWIGNPAPTQVWYADSDMDAYGDPAVTTIACSQPAGYVGNNLDCDDTTDTINPDAPEITGNTIDENCDGSTSCDLSITSINTTDESCPGSGSITVNATCAGCPGGNTDIRYSLDGGAFQVSNVFNGLIADDYTITVQDVNDMTCSLTQNATVVQGADTVNPTAICPVVPPIVTLNASGDGVLSFNALIGYSIDNCAVISETSPTTNFTCVDLGTQQVVLTATDASGNAGTASCDVTVTETIAPTAVCPSSAPVVNIGAGGTGSLPANALAGGNSIDNCGPPTEASPVTNFTCGDIGTQTVVLTATDNEGNTDTAVCNVTVQDAEAPTATCPGVNPTITLDGSGMGTLNANTLGEGNSMDNCTAVVETNPLYTFSCVDVGNQTVVLTATDTYGNFSTTNCTVTVVETVDPVALCPSTPTEVLLDAGGNGSLPANALAGGNSTDNCSIASETSPLTNFICGDLGTQMVILTATDGSGNMHTASCNVEVKEIIDPVAICPVSTIVTLDSNGNGILAANALVGTSTDNCGVPTETNPLVNFDCDDLGLRSVVLTATDASGNKGFANCDITVNSSVEIQIEGDTVPQEIVNNDVTPVAVDDTDFGTQIAGSTTDHTFTIKNLGTNALTLSGSPIVQVTGASQFTVLTQPSGTSIAGGSSLTFVVRYAPAAVGIHNATVVVENLDCDESVYRFSVTGNVGGTSNDFITTWETTSASESITIPAQGTGLNYNVDWGDGMSDTGQTGPAMHTYATAGVYTVKISGTFKGIVFNNTGDKLKIKSIENWGNMPWTTLNYAFFGCSNLVYNATDVPDLSGVTNLAIMFGNCTQFDGNLSSWDVSTITNMSRMFEGATNFTGDLSSWNVSSVTNMSYMFSGASNYNSPMNNWNVSSVTNMEKMFFGASSFNQPLGSWIVSSVQNMHAMFANAATFNQSIANWDVTSVTNMTSMFESAVSFNGDLSGWQPSVLTHASRMFMNNPTYNQPMDSWGTHLGNALYMSLMFFNATAFNQPLNSWNVSSILDFTAMFEGASSFDRDLNNWDVSSCLKTNRMFQNATNFNGSLAGWNLISCTDMSLMFKNATSFNQPIDSWGTNVQNVLNMISMFEGASNFNQAISSWDVGSVTTTAFMFMNASSFNQDIGAWDVSSVTSMGSMFVNATSFNQNINNWDIVSLTSADRMFWGASAFNSPLSGWGADMADVTNWLLMFTDCVSFDQSLAAWDVSNVTNMSLMLNNSGMSVANYDNTLISWAGQSRQNNVTLNVTGLEYCSAESARNTLTDAGGSNWNISGDIRQATCPPSEFITTWEVMVGDLSITIPTFVGETYDYDVDWGDTNISLNQTGNASHTYASAGTYIVKISGDFPRILFGGVGDVLKIKTIESWGNILWTSMESAFNGCANLMYNANIPPILTSVSNMNNMFRDCSSFNGDISNWDVSNVSTFQHTFNGATMFNQNIGSWDVSSGINFNFMFYNATSFNQDISNWDMDLAVYCPFMFGGATSFNQDISNWERAGSSLVGLQNMESMFDGATSFNQDISNWNVSSVTNFKRTFAGAVLFNQNLSVWDISGANSLERMFLSASAFNQDLGTWDMEGVMNVIDMLDNCSLSLANYDATLIGWSGQALSSNLILGSQGLTYCASEEARNAILSPSSFNWTISGDSEDGSCPDYEFITKWETTTAVEMITIPTFGGSSYNYDVDWGDGSIDYGETGDASHTYATAGVYTVKISGDFPRIYFNDTGDKIKIKSIENWGDIQWESFESAFYGCANLIYNASDAPDLSGVSSMNSMFRGCTAVDNADIAIWNVTGITDISQMFMGCSLFNGNLSSWNTSNVVNMSGMFEGCSVFNNNIGSWNTASVMDMSAMFKNCSTFDQNLNSWNTSNVTDMSSMFAFCDVFDQPVSNWVLSSVTNMSSMFESALAFNQVVNNWQRLGSSMANVSDFSRMFKDAGAFNKDISTWNVTGANDMSAMMSPIFNHSLSTWGPKLGNVTDMSDMFSGNTVFNKDITNWDVSGVTDMSGMFNGCTSFNQDLNGWDISNVTDMTQMLSNTGMDLNNYDNTIIGWTSLAVQAGVTLGADGLEYCAATISRNLLMNAPNNWTIVNDSQEASCPDFGDGFITKWEVPGSDLTIKIPITGGGFNYSVDWGDGTFDMDVTNAAEHTYSSPGTYFISIIGDFPRISFNGSQDRLHIRSIVQWGNIDWSSMAWAFRDCSNLIYEATDAPDLSNVVDLTGMFFNTSQFTGDLTNWDVSGITDMKFLFFGSGFNGDISNWNTSSMINFQSTFLKSQFNGDISNWDVSNVTNMNFMFAHSPFNRDLSNWERAGSTIGNVVQMVSMFDGATSFNRDISNWDVSSVVNMSRMFQNCNVFNQPLNSWDVSNVGQFAGMFKNAVVFNQPLNSWNVTSCGNMFEMFINCQSFNQNLSSWTTGNVQNMQGMFYGCTAFDQSLASWNISKVKNMTAMLSNNGMSNANYDLTLIGWGVQNVETNINLHAYSKEYCDGELARQNLIDNFGWNFVGDSKDGSCPAGPPAEALCFDGIDDYVNLGVFDPYGTDGHFTQEAWVYAESIGPSSFSNSVIMQEGGGPTSTILRVGQNGGNNVLASIHHAGGFVDLKGLITVQNWHHLAMTYDRTTFKLYVDGVLVDFAPLTNVPNSGTGNVLIGESGVGGRAFDGKIDEVRIWGVALSQDQIQSQMNTSLIGTEYGLMHNYDFNQGTSLDDNSSITQLIDLVGSAHGTLTNFTLNSTCSNWSHPGAAMTPSDEFILTVETTSVSESFDIPAVGGGHNFIVDWGDGNLNTGVTTSINHVYAQPGLYTVKISGILNHFRFSHSPSRLKVKSLENWGNIPWQNFYGSFTHCANMVNNATDSPDLSNGPNMEIMFYGCKSFTGNLNGWDMSDVTNIAFMFMHSGFDGDVSQWNTGAVTTMRNTFAYCPFNGDLSDWNVANVENMVAMFSGSSYNQPLDNWERSGSTLSNVRFMIHMFSNNTAFNQDIENWNTSGVENMAFMFFNAQSFNQPLANWEVGNVNSLNGMFTKATSFDQNLNNWNTSNVVSTAGMFNFATAYNQPMNNWDMSNTVQLQGMLNNAHSFDQSLAEWDISSATNMIAFMDHSNVSVANYDATLIAWAALNVNPIRFGGTGLMYCAGELARAHLINVKGWNINHDVMDPGCAGYCNCNPAISPLIPNTAGGLHTATIKCDDGDFTHYCDNLGRLLLSLDSQTASTIEPSDVDVNIVPGTRYYESLCLNAGGSEDGSCFITNSDGAIILCRTWDVNATISQDATVRYYFDDTDIAIVQEGTYDLGLTPFTDIEQMWFYKVENGLGHSKPEDLAPADVIIIDNDNSGVGSTTNWALGTTGMDDYYAEYVVSSFSGGGGGGAEKGSSPVCPSIVGNISGDTTLLASGYTKLAVTIAGGVAPYTVTLNEGTVVNNYNSGDSITVFAASLMVFEIQSIIDVSGCPHSFLQGTAKVIVQGDDDIDPVAVCKDHSVDLNAFGVAYIDVNDIDDGSSDNENIAFMSLDQTSFICADGPFPLVTLTVTDFSGNSASCTATVSIGDPLDVCCPDVRTVSNPPTSFKIYKADLQILSDGIIKNGINTTEIRFESGNNILLNSGFEVSSGASFEALINPCNWP